MSSSNLDTSLVRRTIDLNYAKKKKAVSLKWSLINGALFVIFIYDLWNKCPKYTSWLHYTEGILAITFFTSAIHHAYRSWTSSIASRVQAPQAEPKSPTNSLQSDPEVFSLSRSWVSNSDRSFSPTRSLSSSTPHGSPVAIDEFISDKRTLTDYLKKMDDLSSSSLEVTNGLVGSTGLVDVRGSVRSSSPSTYQVSPLSAVSDNSSHMSGSESLGAGSGQLEAALAEHTRALRLWIVLSVLRPLASRQPPPDYLKPFPDHDYVIGRIRELSADAGMSAYRWNSGSANWRPPQPTDSELILHLTGVYLQQHAGLRATPRLLERVRRGERALAALLQVLMEAHQEGRLTKRQLGPHGLNLLWVLQE